MSSYNPFRTKSISEDDWLDIVDELETEVSCFTENYHEEKGVYPDLDDFIELRPVWDHEELYGVIRENMEKTIEQLKRGDSNG